MKPSVKIVLITFGTLLFNIIFWQEKIALNAAFFDLFILGSVFYLYPASFKPPVMKWLLAANLVTLAAVLFHNTFLSKLAFCSTLMLVVVFSQYLHRSVWYAAASALTNYLFAPASLLNSLKTLQRRQFSLYLFKKSIRFLVIPSVLVIVFFVLYNFANAMFQDIINGLALAFQNYFSKFFEWFSWERTGFLLLGLFITTGLLLKSSVSYFSTSDIQKSDELRRKKNNLSTWKKSSWFELLYLIMGKFADGIMALRNENTTGLISLVLLNILLLCINCIDVVYVWFGFKYDHNINLSAYVHEGAGLLIFSILLAMVLLLFFFRGNLNFYKKNKWLRYGAYAWLIQNAVLVVSVLFRDYYYIVHFGLAYKRIGVLIFLVMVLVGLLTVFIKIQQQKTAYYLLRINAWVAIFILVIASCIHWDDTIARYNLAHKDSIELDVKFLLTLSDKTLPLLQKNIGLLDHATTIEGSEGELLYRSNLSPREVFEQRKRTFEESQNSYSWLSWNAADAYTKQQLAKALTNTSAKITSDHNSQ
ncbi:hypothetical protein BH11BAC3_BH11BAC3_12280 [soil metagenome]